MQDGRALKNIPIYSTKSRIKSPESIFLKTKRKNNKIKSLDQITDYAGFRILCLFEKDIFLIHDYFLKELLAKGYSLKEMNIFNWDNVDHIESLQKISKQYYVDLKPATENKESGYKSIHYVIERSIGGKQYAIEVQLRTLLQDVWGELEHSLSYKKGNIHPHIKKSFHLLARDLETMDILLTHLRDISEREQCGDRFSNEKIGPRSCFSYEPELIPKIFNDDKKIHDKYVAYWDHIKTYNLRSKMGDWSKKARELLYNLYQGLSAPDAKESLVVYFFDIEEAFLFYYDGEYDKALEIYNNLKKKYPSHYVIHFRIGEINFIQNHVEKALEAFDESERILSSPKKYDAVNLYKVKSRLALAYWTLGYEYIDIAVEKITQAQETFIKDMASFSSQDNEVLLNNLCWYSLDKYLKNNSEALRTKKQIDVDKATTSYNVALSHFSELEKLLGDENTNSNTFDTAAMFCFHTYKRTKHRPFLDRAKHYCKMMGDRMKYTAFNYRSMNIQLNHIQEIMNEK